jgi:hypothetical protein
VLHKLLLKFSTSATYRRNTSQLAGKVPARTSLPFRPYDCT